jgi:hypothetical protein
VKRSVFGSFAVLVLYVLSIGPAYRVDCGNFHAPLLNLARNRIPGTLLANYVSFWLPKGNRAIWAPRIGVVVIEQNSLVRVQ